MTTTRSKNQKLPAGVTLVSGRYRVRKTYKGEKYTWWFDSPMKAGAHYEKITHQIAQGEFVPPTKLTVNTVIPGGGEMLVEEWLNYWFENDVKSSISDPNTLCLYLQVIRCHLIPAFKGLKLRELGPEAIDLMLRNLKNQKELARGVEKPLGREYTGKVRAYLERALDVAVSYKRIPSNPATLVKAPRVLHGAEDTGQFRDFDEDEQNEIHRAYTPEQVAGFLAAARAEERFYALFVVGFNLGLRPGEYGGLRWSDIDFEAMTISIKRSVKKKQHQVQDKALRDGEPGYTLKIGPIKKSLGQKGRTIRMPSEVAQALKEHRRVQMEERMAKRDIWVDNDLVFPNASGGLLYDGTLRYVYSKVAAKAGIKGAVMPYDMRHTCASLLIKAGWSISDVAALFGDTIKTIYDNYAHPLPGIAEAGTGISTLLASAN